MIPSLHRPAPAVPLAGPGRIGGLFSALLLLVGARAPRRRATLLDLEATPDHLLRDLGFRDGRAAPCRRTLPTE